MSPYLQNTKARITQELQKQKFRKPSRTNRAPLGSSWYLKFFQKLLGGESPAKVPGKFLCRKIRSSVNRRVHFVQEFESCTKCLVFLKNFCGVNTEAHSTRFKFRRNTCSHVGTHEQAFRNFGKKRGIWKQCRIGSRPQFLQTTCFGT